MLPLPSRSSGHPEATRWIKRSMVATDIGFLLYWLASAVLVIPSSPDPTLVAWNWSFLVLDVGAAVTGLVAVLAIRRSTAVAPGPLALQVVSLSLTHAAGLLAVSFWTLRGEFDPAWWAPNLWLTIFPIVAVASLVRAPDRASG